MRYGLAVAFTVFCSTAAAEVGCLTGQLEFGPVENARVQHGQLVFDIEVVSDFEVPLTGLAFGARITHAERPYPIASFWFGEATISGALLPGESLQIVARHHLDDRAEHFAADLAQLEITYWIQNAADLDRHPVYLDTYTMPGWDGSDRSSICRE